MKKLLNKKINVVAGFCGVVTILILFTTNPKEVPIILLMLVPLMSFTSLTLILYQLLGFLAIGKTNARAQRMTLALVCAGTPILLLVLKSIDQLSGRDIILFAILVTLLAFYLGRLRLSTRKE